MTPYRACPACGTRFGPNTVAFSSEKCDKCMSCAKCNDCITDDLDEMYYHHRNYHDHEAMRPLHPTDYHSVRLGVLVNNGCSTACSHA